MIDSTIIKGHQHATGALKKYRETCIQKQWLAKVRKEDLLVRNMLHAALFANSIRFFVPIRGLEIL